MVEIRLLFRIIFCIMVKLLTSNATVAQSVEQLIRNQQVAGSSPASSSKIKQPILSVVLFFIRILDGLEGGSRFSREKRFALRNINHSFPYGKGRC